jgi:hypothetical protein
VLDALDSQLRGERYRASPLLREAAGLAAWQRARQPAGLWAASGRA